MGSPYFARWAQYGLLSPYFARWAQYGLLSPYFARWAQYGLSVALFRPLGSIRALAPAMCSLRCAHTPTQPPYFAIAPYGLSVALFRPLGSIRALVIPGLRYAYPGLYSGAPSGRSISIPRIDNCSFIKRFCLNTKLL